MVVLKSGENDDWADDAEWVYFKVNLLSIDSDGMALSKAGTMHPLAVLRLRGMQNDIGFFMVF